MAAQTMALDQQRTFTPEQLDKAFEIIQYEDYKNMTINSTCELFPGKDPNQYSNL